LSEPGAIVAFAPNISQKVRPMSLPTAAHCFAVYAATIPLVLASGLMIRPEDMIVTGEGGPWVQRKLTQAERDELALHYGTNVERLTPASDEPHGGHERLRPFGRRRSDLRPPEHLSLVKKEA
jgi:hypothetical protein